MGGKNGVGMFARGCGDNEGFSYLQFIAILADLMLLLSKNFTLVDEEMCWSNQRNPKHCGGRKCVVEEREAGSFPVRKVA